MACTSETLKDCDAEDLMEGVASIHTVAIDLYRMHTDLTHIQGFGPTTRRHLKHAMEALLQALRAIAVEEEAIRGELRKRIAP